MDQTSTQIAEIALLLTTAGGLGYSLRSRGYSAVAGYVLAGIIFGSVLHLISPSSPILQFISTLAVSVIAFEIGMTLSPSFLKAEMGRVLPIIAVEILVVTGLVLLVSSSLDLNLADELTLIFVALNTSTAVTYKMMEEKGLLENSKFRNLILALASMEDMIALIQLSLFPILTTRSSAVSLVSTINSIAISLVFSIAFGLFLARRLVSSSMRSGEDMIIITVLSLVALMQTISPLLGLSAALLSLILGISISTVKGIERVLNSIRPIREFFAVIFFVSAGAEMPSLPQPYLLLSVVLLSLFITFIKGFAFSVGAYLIGISGSDAIRLGLYMTPISEFGIVIASYGLSKGLTSAPIYLTSIVTVAVSSLVASLLTKYDRFIATSMVGLMPVPLLKYGERWRVALKELSTGLKVRVRPGASSAIYRVLKVLGREFAVFVFGLYSIILLVYLLTVYSITSLLSLVLIPSYLASLLLPVYFVLSGGSKIREIREDLRPVMKEPFSSLASYSLYILFVWITMVLSFSASVTIEDLGGNTVAYRNLGITSALTSIIVLTIFSIVRNSERVTVSQT